MNRFSRKDTKLICVPKETSPILSVLLLPGLSFSFITHADSEHLVFLFGFGPHLAGLGAWMLFLACCFRVTPGSAWGPCGAGDLLVKHVLSMLSYLSGLQH